MVVKHVGVASAVIFKYPSSVLLLHRSVFNNHYVDTWQLPEGKIETNESTEGALDRELYEELGIRPVDQKYCCNIKTVIKLKAKKIVVMRSVFVTKVQGVFLLSEEHDAYKWFAVSELSNYHLYPGTRTVVKAVMDMHVNTTPNW